jgi:hypothetical protein
MFGERQRARVACPATAGMRLPGGALGGRRSALPSNALIEFVLRYGRGVEGAWPGIGQVP